MVGHSQFIVRNCNIYVYSHICFVLICKFWKIWNINILTCFLDGENKKISSFPVELGSNRGKTLSSLQLNSIYGEFLVRTGCIYGAIWDNINLTTIRCTSWADTVQNLKWVLHILGLVTINWQCCSLYESHIF